MFSHSGDIEGTLSALKRQARIAMVLDCLDAGDADAALRAWRADESEIVVGDPKEVLTDVLYAGLLVNRNGT